MKLKRRSMLALAGIFPLLTSATAWAKHEPEKWNMECDVLVIGAGAAGMAAAVTAAEEGAKKVIVLEKNPSIFLNSTTYSNGIFNAAGSQAQKRNGIEDPGAENFVDEMMKYNHNTADRRLVKLYAENSGETIDWFEKKGIQFKLAPNAAFSVWRTHNNGTETGARYLEVLEKDAKKLGIDILCSTRATALYTNYDGSEVTGAQAVDKDGKDINIRAKKAVIIATGGFMGDPLLIDKNIIEFKGSISGAAPSSTGDGLLMARKIGAETLYADKGGFYGYGVPVDLEKRRGLIFRGHIMGLYGTIVVGEDGKRFIIDETPAATVGTEMAKHKFKHIYAIASQEQLDDFMEHDKSQVIGWSQEKFKQELDNPKGFVRKANTIPELAEKLGISPKALEETIERYNGFVKAGKDEDFGRKYMKGTFEKGPYYGFICQPIGFISLGGLKSSDTMEIEDVYGKRIRHLYAVGEALGGVHGDAYLGGASIGSSFTLGRYVGKLAAAQKDSTN